MKQLNCILLVDDNNHTNFLNRRLIKKMSISAHVKTAENGEEAIEYLNKCLAGNEDDYPTPNLILLDINMPRMNGWEFIEEYKRGGFNFQPPIVMLTTSPNPDDEVKARAIPEISDFLKKPLTQEMLSEIANKHFRKADS